VTDQPSAAVLYELVGHLPRGEMAAVGEALAGTNPAGSLIEVLGIVPTHAGPGACRVEMLIGPQHLNMRGIVQGGAVVALADAAAGWASYATVPSGRFTTIDLAVNFLRSARLGDRLVAIARPVHLGRRLLVLEVMVHRDGDGDGSAGNAAGADDPARSAIARVGCTQMALE
jgi:uncharacterized protein (TIGR00369 family)